MICWRRFSLALAAVAVVSMANCGGSNNLPYNATPAITVLYPNYVYAGGSGFTLYITGTGFISTTSVYWNGTQLSNAVFNAATTQIQVPIPASNVLTAGIAQITASNPPPGGGQSVSAATFLIKPPLNPMPSISSLNPTSVAAGSGAFTLTVNGTNFVPISVVAWNGNPRATTYVPPQAATSTSPATPAYLTAQILSSDVATANPAVQVTVSNPAPGGGVSPPALFTVTDPSGASRKFPQVVSVNATGGPADGRSNGPAISADGRYVAFYSQAKNLIAEGASGNIFVRDTCLGAANCTPQTIAVDIAPDGSAPNAESSEQVALSADGRFAAFVSKASNLVEGVQAPNAYGVNVFVRDLCLGMNAPSGCEPHTELVSVDANGEYSGGVAISPSISSDGRFVAFSASATNLVSGQRGTAFQVFVRDTCQGPTSMVGCVPETYQVSLGDEDGLGLAVSVAPAISASGRYVAFEVWALELSPASAQRPVQVFLRDTCLGADAPAGCVPSARKVSVSADGSLGDAQNLSPVVSADARFVVFQSQVIHPASGERSGVQRAFLRDTCMGQAEESGCVPSTTLISPDVVTAAALENGDTFSPWISASGRYITFVVGTPENLDASSASRTGSLFVRDTCFGAANRCFPRTYRVTVSTAVGSATPITAYKLSRVPLSADGRVAAVSSGGLVPTEPSSNMGDVFLTAIPY